MNEREIISLEQSYAANVYSKRPIVAVKGKGTLIWDINGKEYIDCTGAYGVSVVGHCHPKVVEAIQRQAELLIACHSSLYNDARSEFLKKLVSITPHGLKRTFLSNSGAEAVEAAIKLARRYTSKPEIIAFIGGFHGKTMGALSATWKNKYRIPFEPLVPCFKHVQYGKIQGLEAAITEKTGAIIVEPIQGESGVNIPPEGFLKELREICDDKKILLILDEIQTGFGRTGKMFSHEYSGITPDILCLAKSLGGGVPIGVTVATDQIMSSFKLGEHTSTFSGNPLICAAASAAIDVVVEEKLPERAEVLGRYFIEKLGKLQEKYRIIREIRGRGLMIGIEFRFDVLNLILSALKRNVIILDAGSNILRFLPPLVISKEQIDKVVSVLDVVIGEENAKFLG
ncbi:aspartate aminotransferase family protein [Candidatus Bathyarchaeota archaeon]|nr:aspartate aminotransferase family protein [Candidatus Bathyarchaeota archaeon]